MNNENIRGSAEKNASRNCPGCGSVMRFAPDAGGMKCDACGTVVKLDLETGAGQYVENALNADSFSKASRNWGSEIHNVRCNACGAETVVTGSTKSTQCPFCGSNQVITAQEESDAIAPTHVIPFSISEKQAIAKFKDWIKTNWFAPKKCKQSVGSNGLKGIYVPFWTFDSDTDSDYTGNWGEEYTVYVTETYEDDGETKTRVVPKTEIRWHHTSGRYAEFMNDVLIAALDEKDSYILGLYTSVEPYDYTKLLSFKPEYLAGFLAERYSLDMESGWKRAEEQIKDIIKEGINKKICNDHCTSHSSVSTVNTKHANRTYKHILLPIWMSSYKYRNKLYHFMVNGQSGKVVGDFPFSIFKLLMIGLGIAAIIGLIIYFFMQ